MEAEADVYKSFVKITEGKSHVSSLHTFCLGFFWVAIIATTTFAYKYLEFRVQPVNFDGGAVLLIVISLISFLASLLTRRRRNHEYKRLREGALEIHEVFRSGKFVINQRKGAL